MRNIRHIVATLLALAVLLTCSGCKNSGGGLFHPDYPVKIGDITLKKAPERVVSLSTATTSILTLMGYSERLVGVDNDYKGETDKPRTGNALVPEENAILDLNPDLIITTAPVSEDFAAKLKLRDVTVAVLPVPSNFENLSEYYTNLASLLSGGNTGKELSVAYTKALTENFNSISKYLSGKQPVSSCILFENGYIATGKTFLGDILTRVGGKNVANDRSDIKITSAELAALAPEVIFCPQGLAAGLSADKELANVPAVKNQKIYEVDLAGIGTMGEDFMNTVYAITAKLYPDFVPNSTDTSSQASKK